MSYALLQLTAVFWSRVLLYLITNHDDLGASCSSECWSWRVYQNCTHILEYLTQEYAAGQRWEIKLGRVLSVRENCSFTSKKLSVCLISPWGGSRFSQGKLLQGDPALSVEIQKNWHSFPWCLCLGKCAHLQGPFQSKVLDNSVIS